MDVQDVQPPAVAPLGHCGTSSNSNPSRPLGQVCQPVQPGDLGALIHQQSPEQESGTEEEACRPWAALHCTLESDDFFHEFTADFKHFIKLVIIRLSLDQCLARRRGQQPCRQGVAQADSEDVWVALPPIKDSVCCSSSVSHFASTSGVYARARSCGGGGMLPGTLEATRCKGEAAPGPSMVTLHAPRPRSHRAVAGYAPFSATQTLAGSSALDQAMAVDGYCTWVDVALGRGSAGAALAVLLGREVERTRAYALQLVLRAAHHVSPPCCTAQHRRPSSQSPPPSKACRSECLTRWQGWREPQAPHALGAAPPPPAPRRAHGRFAARTARDHR